MGNAVSIVPTKKNRMRAMLMLIRSDSPDSISHAERVLAEYPEYLLRRVPAFTSQSRRPSTTVWHVAAAQPSHGAQLISMLAATLRARIQSLSLKNITALTAALQLSSQPSYSKQQFLELFLPLFSEHHTDTASSTGMSTDTAGNNTRNRHGTSTGVTSSSDLQQPRQQQVEDVFRAVMVAVLDGRNARGQTPLMVAASRGCDAVQRLLLDMGADPLAVDCRDGRSCCGLRRAAERRGPLSLPPRAA